MYKVQDAIFTLALLKTPLQICSFPSVVVFGSVKDGFFEKYLEFDIFQVKHFYLSFLSILAFFAERGDNECLQGLILTKNNENYFWRTFISETSEGSKKTLSLGVEKNCDILFTLEFFLEELNNLILCLKECLKFSVPLNDTEFQFLCYCEKLESVTPIKTARFSDEEFHKLFNSKTFNITSNVQKKKLQVTFNYYYELFAIINLLNSIHTDEEPFDF